MRQRRFINPNSLLLLCVVSLLAIVCSARVAGAQEKRTLQDAKRVIVISLDGLDWRYVSSPNSSLRIPTLRRLMTEGVSSSVVTVYPSVTYPAHTSISTGAYPARHGIFGNDIFDPSMLHSREWYWFARAIKVDTLWDAAKRANLSTAMVSWPVATGAGDHNVPEILKLGGKFPDTLALMKANARPQGLVEEIERADAQLYARVSRDEQDDMRTRFAEYVIERKRPQVFLMHLFDLDHFEHDFGPFTPEANAILEKTDAYVARILAAAERAGTLNETAVFIVSDHGFLPISQQIHPGVLLERAGLLKVSEEKDAQGRTRTVVKEWRALPYTSSGSCAIILRDPKDTDALKRVRAVFQDFTEGKSSAFPGMGKKSLRVLEAREIRSLHADPRASFVLEAEDGYAFGNNYAGQPITSTNTRGTHGYLPSRYLNTFIASGAGIHRRGLLNGRRPIRMIDLGPTIARTLKLRLRDAEGKAFLLK
ncbi:MAG: alkaline phosphatase family protein [Pyrinomonadaceae bacterium]|nr:alkaline phosphatase family protein [Pyrinomonadaceae bacterium]